MVEKTASRILEKPFSFSSISVALANARKVLENENDF